MDLVVSEIDASPLQPRIGHSSVPAADSLLIWGGDSGDEHRPHQDGAVLSLTGGGWDAIPPAPVPPRTQHVAVWTGTEMIVWGGATSEPGPDRHAWDGAAYHPQDDTWRPIAPAPEGRSHAMGVATDEWMVIGGGHTPNRPTDSLLSYAIADDRWHATDIDIQVQAMAATGPGPVLLAGTDTDRALAVRRYEPEGESVSVVPHDVELTGSLRYLGIASNDRGSAYLLASDDTRTHVARLSGEGTLETIASHDVRDLRPPVDLVVAPYDRGAMWVTSAEEVISLNGRNLSVFDPHSGGLGYRRLTELADYCGAEAAEALSAQGLIAWGGRNCHNGDTSLTNRGLRIQLPS
ncbi:hypothetical protein CLV72_1011112 [Allonocardiopsis opalescens]|uniref:Kelch motif protein n=2 Tax=Allonocardiopsis opalescens TaxID=1144618 RepID=A0A2T0QF48_9ACTN|nr:hypothetical protein CLV72_1011112 [Allonocardiopsis opalescens]